MKRADFLVAFETHLRIVAEGRKTKLGRKRLASYVIKRVSWAVCPFFHYASRLYLGHIPTDNYIEASHYFIRWADSKRLKNQMVEVIERVPGE